MGNKIGKNRQVVDEKYTRPHGLYQHRDIDHKKLRKLILDSKLAPCYPGLDDHSLNLEECPICFLYYPSLNRSRCCMKGICTECFLQMKPSHSTRPTQNMESRAKDVTDENDGTENESTGSVHPRDKKLQKSTRVEREGRNPRDMRREGRCLKDEKLGRKFIRGEGSRRKSKLGSSELNFGRSEITQAIRRTGGAPEQLETPHSPGAGGAPIEWRRFTRPNTRGGVFEGASPAS